MNINILDGVITITKEEAFEYATRCAREEGILVRNLLVVQHMRY